MYAIRSYYDPERPEDRPDRGHGVVRGLHDLCLGGLTRVVDIALEQEGKAQILRVILELRLDLGRHVALGRTDLHQRVIGDDARAHALFGLFHEVVDAGDLGGQRAGADQAHHIGHVDRVFRLARLLVGNADKGEGSYNFV